MSALTGDAASLLFCLSAIRRSTIPNSSPTRSRLWRPARCRFRRRRSSEQSRANITGICSSHDPGFRRSSSGRGLETCRPLAPVTRKILARVASANSDSAKYERSLGGAGVWDRFASPRGMLGPYSPRINFIFHCINRQPFPPPAGFSPLSRWRHQFQSSHRGAARGPSPLQTAAACW